MLWTMFFVLLILTVALMLRVGAQSTFFDGWPHHKRRRRHPSYRRLS